MQGSESTASGFAPAGPEPSGRIRVPRLVLLPRLLHLFTSLPMLAGAAFLVIRLRERTYTSATLCYQHRSRTVLRSWPNADATGAPLQRHRNISRILD